ncbi:B12-binding domain-containing radical SAM protein [Sandaracinus amylolyticus]|uniref:Fe-S oxidoreductase n=1 Tax=Sandaracinus amylolyticus TaxID=927083 RepID=A0A0F6YG67_9BACT|nr:radical SAM protein [Sandaracinus amylolyticus]AKF03497.1 Fe-S oxidoreductase [Sandaracinus amylolyticus]
MSPRVLVVTGGLVSAEDTDLLEALRKQIAALRGSQAVWLDLQIKLHAAERLLAADRHRRSETFRRASYREAVERFDGHAPIGEIPELTEVALATLLEHEGLEVECTTYSKLHADASLRERLLARTDAVFASTTLLHDRAEMDPMLAMLKRPHNKVVAGGALASMLHATWEGSSAIDLLAVGYGEMLVPAIARWLRTGELVAPERGRIEERGGTPILFSGVPEGRVLDALPAPDWRIAERVHGRRFRMAHYESVRGCPYRCAFCNYPYLFDDTKFRYRSAERIDADWAALEAQGIEYVSCLDSLFTMPRKRLQELCRRLIARGSRLKWICYARADDLCDLPTAQLMKDAGCVQVQIGVESGSDVILKNMNKACTADENRRALINCRKVGLTSLVTVIVGFPGETRETVDETYALLASAPPDVFYVVAFSTWVEGVPILKDESKKKHGLVTLGGVPSPAPYWRHPGMSCTEVSHEVKRLNEKLIEHRVGLEGFLFYRGLLGYDPADREALLDFQRDVMRGQPILRGIVRGLDAFVHRQLVRDVEARLGAARAMSA